MALLGYKKSDDSGRSATIFEGSDGKAFARFRLNLEWNKDISSLAWAAHEKNTQFFDPFYQELSSIGFYEQDDWRRVSENKLDDLIKSNGSLAETYGWPIGWEEWNTVQAGISSGIYAKANPNPSIPFSIVYVSCASVIR